LVVLAEEIAIKSDVSLVGASDFVFKQTAKTKYFDCEILFLALWNNGTSQNFGSNKTKIRNLRNF
jgi:hypothetical protein